VVGLVAIMSVTLRKSYAGLIVFQSAPVVIAKLDTLGIEASMETHEKFSQAPSISSVMLRSRKRLISKQNKHPIAFFVCRLVHHP
jgi:fumarate reductase subunit C